MEFFKRWIWIVRCYERALHLGRRCHLRREGKLHPVGWQLDDHRCIGRVRWRRGENSGLNRLRWLYQRCFPVARFVICQGSVASMRSKYIKIIKELSMLAAGAIYVKEGSFTQLGGTSTITDALAGSDGGVVRMLRNPFLLGSSRKVFVDIQCSP